jgi:hypothetical protein
LHAVCRRRFSRRQRFSVKLRPLESFFYAGIAMRIMLIASAILAASVSTALAQSTTAAPAPQPAAAAQPAPAAPSQQWSLDHGRSEDAANAAKAAAIGAAIKEIVAAAKAQAAPPDPESSSDLVGNGDAVITAAAPRTTEQQKADALAQAAWQTRCRPSVVEDREGIRRVKYAESDCDLTRYNTAGR